MIGWELWRDFFRLYVHGLRVGTARSIVGARVTIIYFLWIFFDGTLCFGNLFVKPRPASPRICADREVAAINSDLSRKDIFF